MIVVMEFIFLKINHGNLFLTIIGRKTIIIIYLRWFIQQLDFGILECFMEINF